MQPQCGFVDKSNKKKKLRHIKSIKTSLNTLFFVDILLNIKPLSKGFFSFAHSHFLLLYI